MDSRVWVVRLVVIVMVTAGLGTASIGSATRSDAAPWDAETCSPNSFRTTTAAAGGHECVANYRAHGNRGRLAHLIDPQRANNPEEVYDLSEGIAEYVAQGRLVAKVTGGSTSSVPPNVQWETTMPKDARRLDVMTYDPTSDSGDVLVAELKGDWLGSRDSALAQATGYVDEIRNHTDHGAKPWHVGQGTYRDSFYRGKRCEAGDAGEVDGWYYTVTAPMAGVVYIERETSRCSEERKVTDERLAEIQQVELAFEIAEDGGDVGSELMPTGSDVNGNGVPDYVDVASYAGSGEVEYEVPAEPYEEWSAPVDELVTHAALVAVDTGLIRLTSKYGDDATKKVLDVVVKTMMSTANKFDDQFADRLAAQLTGMKVERPLSAVVGKGAASSLRAGVGDAGSRIIERNGVRYVRGILTEAQSRALAKLLARYAARVGTSSAVGMIPVVGQVVMVVLDVYFTVQLILDISDLLGFNVWGDPHLVTLDRRIYDLQSAGEFVLARTDAGSAVQGRFVPTNSRVSVMGRVAIGTGSDRFELTDSGALLNGESLSLQGFMLTEDGLLVGHTSGNWVVRASDGLTLVGSRPSNMRVLAPEGVVTEGLLGDNDGDPDNDLAFPDGSPLTSNEASALHGPYADSWRVTEGTSLFTYASGESTNTFTDPSFPDDITTIGDFSATEIDAANATCIDQGVVEGPSVNACVLDLLVTSDDSFTSAAAATQAVIDPGTERFDAHGVLREDFDEAIAANLQAETTLEVTDTSRAAGPFFDASPYGFALLSVPRHDEATITARVLVLGSSTEDRRVTVSADDTTDATFSLTGEGSVLSGPSGTSVTGDGSGVTPAGTSYDAFEITVPLTHFGDAMSVEVSSTNIHAILDSGFAVDDVQISLSAPPADVVDGLTLPFSASADLGEGLGSLETPGAADEYHFTVEAGTAPNVLVETSAASDVRVQIRDDNGDLVEPTSTDNHLLYGSLPGGSYSLVVAGRSGAVASYSLPVVAPIPQEFSLQVGQKVEPGTIGGTAVEGAGGLETTASEDVYNFTIPAGGQRVVFDSEEHNWSLYYGSKLIRLSDGANLGKINGHREYDLAAGDYQIVVARPGHTGTYWFNTQTG